ncbi:TPA: hypothetical protein QCI71_003422 [Enterobacter chuandaensis]|uniref:hypothetical protein n=1 Tax=Enterobacter nematophilus TaxID=2994648 RepID=UPI0032F79D4E|nr:hypothetical protein [Enterobacter chuandaensis]
MPLTTPVNGWKKPYNRGFLASLSESSTRSGGSDGTNNDRNNYVQLFLTFFIIQIELSKTLFKGGDKNNGREKLTTSAILTLLF